MTHKGHIFIAYYSGKHTETFGNYTIPTVSDDDGKTFREGSYLCAVVSKLTRPIPPPTKPNTPR